jgi:hypothetical protein
VTKVLDAVLEAITHWRDQRKRRKLEDEARRKEAAIERAREFLKDHNAWVDDFNERNRILASNPEAAELMRLIRALEGRAIRGAGEPAQDQDAGEGKA